MLDRSVSVQNTELHVIFKWPEQLRNISSPECCLLLKAEYADSLFADQLLMEIAVLLGQFCSSHSPCVGLSDKRDCDDKARESLTHIDKNIKAQFL